MNSYNLGRLGEELAANWYRSNGYAILGRNIRVHGKRQIGEIDLLVSKGRHLVFVEVKARRSSAFGFPAEAVTGLKRRKLLMAAALFMQRHPEFDDFPRRFDVAEVNIDSRENPVIILENAIEDD